MAETTAEAPASAPATPKGKKTKGSAKKASSAPSHPPVAQMVIAAVKNLKERGGSSTQAIKKYISSNYKIDAEKKSKFIGKYLKTAVASGALIQTKGKGASGSFKLGGSGEPKTKETVKKEKSSPAKTKRTVAAKKASVKTASRTPSKSKKAKKPPTTPKAPKVKVASKIKAPAKAKSPKKRSAPAARKASPRKK